MFLCSRLFFLLSLFSLSFSTVYAYEHMCLLIVEPFSSSDNVEANRQAIAFEQCCSVVWTRWANTCLMKTIRVDTRGYAPTIGKAVAPFIGSSPQQCSFPDGFQKPIDAVFGSISEEETTSLATFFGSFQKPIVSSSSKSSKLNNPLLYPTFSRPGPSYDQEAMVFGSLIKTFGWTRIALLFLDETRAFASYFEKHPDLFRGLYYAISETDLSGSISEKLLMIQEKQYRIVIVDAEPFIAQVVMQTADKFGMLGNGDYLFFSTSRWTPEVPLPSVMASGIPWKTSRDKIQFNENERTIMDGLVGVSSNFLRQDVMLSFVRNSMAYDDSWWPPSHMEAPGPSVYYAYTACAYLYKAYMNYTLTRNQNTTESQSYTYLDAINQVEYEDSYKTRTKFNVDGTRLTFFNITNLVDGEFVSIGQWSSESGFTFHSPIHWPGNADPIGDLVPLKLFVLPNWTSDLIWGFLITSLLLTLFFHRLLWIQQKHEVIKASSHLFCQVIVLGCFITNTGVFVLQLTNFSIGCMSIPISVIYGCALVFGSLIIKTWRIHRIFNTRILKDSQVIHDKDLLFRLFLVLLFYTICIMIWFLADPPLVHDFDYKVGTFIHICSCQSTATWLGLIAGISSVGMLIGVYLAYKIREINHSFNESQYISISLSVITVLAIFLLSMVLAFNDQPILTLICKTVGVSTSTLLIELIFFMPKFWDIYVTKAWVDYQSDSSYVSGVLVHRSSRHSAVRNNGNANGLLNRKEGEGGGHSKQSRQSRIHDDVKKQMKHQEKEKMGDLCESIQKRSLGHGHGPEHVVRRFLTLQNVDGQEQGQGQGVFQTLVRPSPKTLQMVIPTSSLLNPGSVSSSSSSSSSSSLLSSPLKYAALPPPHSIHPYPASIYNFSLLQANSSPNHQTSSSSYSNSKSNTPIHIQKMPISMPISAPIQASASSASSSCSLPSSSSSSSSSSLSVSSSIATALPASITTPKRS